MHKNDMIGDRGGCGCSGCARNEVNPRKERELPEYVKCGCGEPRREPSWGLRGYPIASVYSVLQDWHDIYDTETALKRGTIFKELDLPFYGDRCSDNGFSNDGRNNDHNPCDCRHGGGRNGR